MKHLTILLTLFAVALGQPAQAQSSSDRALRYIERYKDIAIQEMERAGIPASIKLAQGLLESGAGESYLARNANNHFGIKCGSNWNGKEVYRKDDDRNDRGEIIKSCFRGYRNGNASFVAHSEFLRDPKKAFRYGFLFRLNPQDYKRWAEGLRRAGYATDPNYPQKLIANIERYNLHQYDRIPMELEDQPGTVPTDVETPISELVRGILNTNDVTYFVSDEAISVDEVARRVDISVRKLIEYNEPLTTGGQQVLPGQRVFIQKKRSSYRGREQYHTVQAGETLQQISDRYAIRMDKLLNRNRLVSADQRIAPGEKIKLRGSKLKEPPRLGGVPIVQPTSPTIPTDNDGNIELEDPTVPPLEEDPDFEPPVDPQPTVPIPNPNPPINPGNQPDFGDGNPTPTPPPTNTGNQPDFGNGNPPTTPTTPPTTNPGNGTPPTTPPVTTPTAPVRKYHGVVKGDTLYNISRRYNLTVDQLKQLNGLTSNVISIGQQLIVQ